MVIEKQLYERQLELIFRMLLENKTNEQIASELKISIRSVQNYKRRLGQRYMTYQRQKTDSTIFLEMNLLKNRLLKLYRSLEYKVVDSETGASDSARCADVAASIAINVIKLESDGTKAIQEIISKNININKGHRCLNNLQSKNDESDNIKKEEYDPNRKF